MLPDKPLKIKETPNRRSFVERLIIIIIAAVIIWICFQARQVLLLAFAGIVLGIVIGGCSRAIASILPWPKHNRRRYLCSLWIFMLTSLALLAAGCYFIGPRTVNDIQQLDTEIPKAIETIKDFPPVQAYLSNRDEGISSKQISTITGAVTSAVQKVLSGTIFAVTSLVFILFVGLFGAAQPDYYRRAICSFFPPSLRKDCDQTVRACAKSLWEWVQAQGLAMLIIATLSIIGLFVIDVRYALTLGIIAGLFQFVPYIGPFASAIPALLVAITMSPQTALWVGLLYIGIQFAEGNFITPLVMKNKTDLPPLATLLSTVLFGAVFGILGAIVATPLAVILMTLKQEVYEKRILQAEKPDIQLTSR